VRQVRLDLKAARDATIPDVIAADLDVLFCGINPGLWSAATGHHFARPGNRFWPALHRGGFTPTQLRPDQQETLLGYGLGITNVAARASARADELTPDELRAGADILTAKLATFRPHWLVVLGVTAYRVAFGRPKAAIGPQDDRFGATRVWILPNPSGLNAHFNLERLSAEFARLRHAVSGPVADRPEGDRP
jgi:TDG/mug DNA glycosylase family protein